MLAVGFIHSSILVLSQHFADLFFSSPFCLSLQFRVRRRFTAEGGSEKTVQAFSVSHPLSPLIPGAEAAQAHETRERWCSPHRMLADRQADRRTLLLISFPCLCRSSGCWTSSRLLRRWRTSASCKSCCTAVHFLFTVQISFKGGGGGVGSGGDPGGKHVCSKRLAVAMAAPACSPLKAHALFLF